VTSKAVSIELEEGKRTILVNNVLIYLARPVLLRGGSLYISASDYHKTVEPLLLPQRFSPVPRLKIIVIDPGHGGRDDGAQNKALQLKEKILTLDLANRLKSQLNDRGYTVYLTRTSDTYVELENRADTANRRNADLFISLHLNASTDTSVRGAETYILPPFGQPSSTGTDGDGEHLSGNQYDAWSAIAGYYVQKELSGDVGATDRGLRRARFVVLRDLDCPGMLIESGYITNQGEGYKLSTAAYRQRVVQGIADAVDAYASALKRLSAK
jgi:N-acetylmuramoyl-L-alanine amidase